ncbi:MAG: hypothetical protein WAU86_13955 [Oricola sp.]
MTVRLLVTGFTPFPGAPVNPTEHLIRRFEADPPLSREDAEFRFAVLPVEYRAAIPALEDAAADFDPHIAVHFGLAQEAAGFRLETLARNEIVARIPDNAGDRPEPGAIRDGSGHVASSLPLAEIATALDAAGLPVEWSDNAGGYLCNYVFYHSAGGICRGLSGAMHGFVHVGQVNLPGAMSGEAAMDFNKLVQGTELILQTCIRRFRNR